MILSILIFGVSFALYFYAPTKYSYEFCSLVVLLFALSAIITIKRRSFEGNLFNFHTLFAISFFFVNFVYPIFLFPTLPNYFPVYGLDFDENLINKCTALALLGYSAYSVGVCLYSRKKTLSGNKIGFRISDPKYNKVISYLCIALLYPLFLLLLLLAANGILSRKFDAFSEVPSYLTVLIQILFTLYIILFLKSKQGQKIGLIRSFWHMNFFFKIILIFYLGVYIYTGDRGPAIQVVLAFLFCHSFFVKKITFWKIAIYVTLGMFILTFISSSRNTNGAFFQSGAENLNITSFVDIGMDLIVNNRNLYVGYEYAERYGFDYGAGLMSYVLAPFPLLPTLFTNTFHNKDPSELTSSYIITEYSGANYGLGTNVVADLYMQFGVCSVIFFLLLFGFLISLFETRAKLNCMNSIMVIVYFTSYSIYIPRSALFDSLRYIFWSVFIYYAFYYLVKSSKYFIYKSKIA